MFNYDEFENLSSGIEQGDYIKEYLKPTGSSTADEKYQIITERINEINWKYISHKCDLKPEFYTYKISLTEYGFTQGYETRYNDIGMIDLLYGDIICEFKDLSIIHENKMIMEYIIDYIKNNQQWVEPPFGKVEGVAYPPYRKYWFGYFLTYDFYHTYTYEIVRQSSSSGTSSSSISSNSSDFKEIKTEINDFIYKFCGCPQNYLIKYQTLPIDFITNNIENLSIDDLCKHQLFDNQFFSDNIYGITYFKSNDNNDSESSNSSSSESSTEQVLVNWNFELLSKYQRWDLTDNDFINNFIKSNWDKINWDNVCKYQNVPSGFSDSVIFENSQTLTEKIGFDTDVKIEEYKDINPYFQTLDNKLEKISSWFNIENPDDSNDQKYFFAYKSVTKDNKENYRPRESFIQGNSYDCSMKNTNERYTNRYAVGIQESFFEHYGTDKFIKVKVFVKDIFEITDFGRLYVNKFEVVEDVV